MSLKHRLGLARVDGPQNLSQFLPPSNSSWWKLSLYNWLDEKHDIWASNAGWAWQVLMGPGIPLSDSFRFSLLLILLDGNWFFKNWFDQKYDTWASNAGWAWQVLMGPWIPPSDSFWFSLLPILLDGNCIYINWLDQNHDILASICWHTLNQNIWVSSTPVINVILKQHWRVVVETYKIKTSGCQGILVINVTIKQQWRMICWDILSQDMRVSSIPAINVIIIQHRRLIICWHIWNQNIRVSSIPVINVTIKQHRGMLCQNIKTSGCQVSLWSMWF